MYQARKRLTQTQFAKLVIWLTNYKGSKTTISVLTEKATEHFDFEVGEESISRALNEFDLASSLLANVRTGKTKADLIDRIEYLELAVEELSQRLAAIEVETDKVEEYPLGWKNDE